MQSQEANLNRVVSGIALLVKEFLRAVIEKAAGDEAQAVRPRFLASELHKFVAERADIAPASADRVLRELRLIGWCDYRIVNRRESLYELTRWALFNA